MRGRAMRKRRRRSASSTRSVLPSDSPVIARGTSASGRCVVARATRRPPPTSIITTCSAPAAWARYSVWPMNAMPASLITLFCTGAVTIAAYSPARHPRIARSRTASTYRALPASSLPGVAGRVSGTCSMRGQPPRSPRSPMTTSCAPRASRATRTQSSGPTPAGSPEVSAMSGLAFVKPQLDVGLVAQLPQPFLVRLVGLALAQRLPGLQALALGGEIARAPLEHLDQVVAEGRAHGLADLRQFQLLVGAFELRHRVAGIDPV